MFERTVDTSDMDVMVDTPDSKTSAEMSDIAAALDEGECREAGEDVAGEASFDPSRRKATADGSDISNGLEYWKEL